MNPGHLEGSDPVSNPSQDTQGNIEVIDVIEDWDLPFHLANTIEYIAGHEYKGTAIQDLNKAAWYLNRYINILTTEENIAKLSVDTNHEE